MTVRKMLLTSVMSLSLLSGTAFAQSVFIDNATVVTNGSQGILENADVIINNGRVTSIGSDLTAPDGATVINAAGEWVTPGLFAPIAQIGLVEIGLEDSTNDTRSKVSRAI